MAGSLDSVMNSALDGIKKMVDVDTVIGDPIKASETVTLIPISKVSFGFAAGGSSFGKQESKENFGGGAGGGVKVTPVGFIVVNGDNVRMMSISDHPDAVDKIASYMPGIVDKVSEFFSKNKETKTEESEDKSE